MFLESEKKFIAITQRLDNTNTYNEEREVLSTDWGIFFREYLSDFLMLPLSYACDITEYLPNISGVIFSGGNDLSLFSDNPLSQKRDKFEQELIESCMRDSIPILGICRGAQMIGSYFGSQLTHCMNHTKPHVVFQNSMTKDSNKRDSTHSTIPKKTSFMVNSFHNYGIKKLGDALIGLATSHDGFIEAFKHKKYPLFGIMWHIERKGGLENTEIFDNFLTNIKEKK
ncbi:gamma-glutamyl-gamma-aminobutyrate hydrolase [Helicobacter didelphidarum]|uniref:Gamma-glutamyl-gamma-aminobutyrate hydrolase n=1 Tax=Helicobacter didelphidarum TaxID=2040648 RepID=A0A3D8IQX5_9HELI|nr:gamma-glutamyl-CDP-amidate hydrolase [Helicobacter didelphidarum]RDU67011.1 gamma-glutamyl-gamma-aminobutyrate hydrolase [Helicobacter didelphidarum]